MTFFKRIQQLNLFSKKLIVFSIIFIVSLPLIFFIGKNFQKKLKEFEKEEFLETLNIQEIKEKKEALESEFRLEKEKLEEIEKLFSTSTTSAE